MLCNRITKPKKFSKKQIAECEKCKHISGKKIWCCLFGVYIKPQYPSIIKQAKNFGKAAIKQAVKGNPKRSDEETARIILICEGCDYYIKDKMRCIKCGCRMQNKIPWQTTHCKIGKW